MKFISQTYSKVDRVTAVTLAASNVTTGTTFVPYMGCVVVGLKTRSSVAKTFRARLARAGVSQYTEDFAVAIGVNRLLFTTPHVVTSAYAGVVYTVSLWATDSSGHLEVTAGASTIALRDAYWSREGGTFGTGVSAAGDAVPTANTIYGVPIEPILLFNGLMR